MRIPIPYIVILALIVILFLQRECTPKPKPGNTVKTDTVITHDTVYIPLKKDTTYKPKVKKSIPPVSIPDSLKITKVDSTYALLLNKYNNLLKEYTYKNVYQDSVKVETYGYVVSTDTIQYNKLFSRKFQYDLNIPKIVDTVKIKTTAYSEPKRQVYIGGGVSGTNSFGNVTANVGLLYKTKKDNIYNPTVGLTTSGNVIYGINMYWLIKVKK